MRVCELANHPNVIGFLQTNYKIWMRPEVYEMHIKVYEMHIKVTLIQFKSRPLFVIHIYEIVKLLCNYMLGLPRGYGVD